MKHAHEEKSWLWALEPKWLRAEATKANTNVFAQKTMCIAVGC
jgi:hypothetical protein